MPNSLKSRLKKLEHQGLLSEKDLNRIVVIPNNATNGQVIKSMFSISKETFTNYSTVEVYGLDDEKTSTEFYADWWNAPYKKGENNG